MSHFSHRFHLHDAKEHVAEITAATILAVLLVAIAYVDVVVFLVCLGVLVILPVVSRIFGNSD